MNTICAKILVTEPWKIEFVADQYTEKIDGPNEVIVKNRYSNISVGTELACIAGQEDWFNIPATPGYTSVGEIVEKGEGVNHVDTGDIVYTMGPHAGYFKIDITDRWHGLCIKVPQDIKQDYAAFTHMAGIAMTSLRASTVELGDFVLVTGLGVIGNLACQLAQLQGANVIATDIVDSRLKVARECGIEHAYHSQKEDIKTKIQKLTRGKGVSTFIDATGAPAVVEQFAETVSFNGDIILLGSPREPHQTNLTDMLQKVHLLPNSLNIKGALEFIYPTHENEFIKHSIERNSKIILELIKNERLCIKPFYTHKLHPSDAEMAYKGLRDHKEEYLGVVFDWTGLQNVA